MSDFILIHLKQNNISMLIRISNIEDVCAEEYGSGINLKSGMVYLVNETVEKIFRMIKECQE